MKMYAFVRSTAPRILNQTVKEKQEKSHSEDSTVHEEESTVRKRIRENHSEVDAGRLRPNTSSDDDSGCPSFSKYIYFLFAPTLIYKDHYPR